MRAEFAVHEQCVGIRTPGTAEVNPSYTFGSRQAAVIEDVAIGNILRRRSRRNVRILLAVDGAVLEPCSRRAENKVGCTFYITVLEINTRAGSARIDGVLVTQQAAIHEHEAVALGVQCHRLAKACGIILYRNVLEGYVCTLHLHRVRAESTHGLVGPDKADVGVVVVCYDGLFGTFTANLDVSKPRRNDYLLLVNAILNVYNLMVFHKCAAHFNGFTYRTELPGAVP